MHFLILGFFAGILAVQCLPALVPVWCAIPVLAVALVFRRWLIVACSIGALWAGGWAALVLADRLAPELQGESVIVSGRVLGFPVRTADGIRFELAIDTLRTAGRDWDAPARARVTWFRTEVEPRLGERWQLVVRLRRPWGLRNPGTYDYERWLFRHRIRAMGYVVESTHNQRLATPARWSVDHMRDAVDRQLQQRYGDREYFDILLALLTGSQSGIADTQWDLLRRTGTAHLVSVSGMHISLAALLGFLLGRGLWSLAPRALLYVTAQSAGWSAALLAAFGYALLAGFSTPCLRALIMVAVAVLQRWRGRHVAGVDTLCLALLAILIIDPLSVLDTGFWLSFAAVAIIFLILAGRAGQVSLPVRLLRVHLALGLGLAPLAAGFFQQNPLYGPLANLLAVPLVTILASPCLFAGAALAMAGLTWGDALVDIAHRCVSYMMSFLERVASLPAATLDLAAPGLWAIAAALVGVALLLLPRGIALRWLGIFWLLPLLLGKPAAPVNGTAVVHVLDVGQGLAVVVQTAHHVLVYDTGPRIGSTDAGGQVVVPFLRQLRVRRLDRVVISHADNDHAGGLRTLAQEFPIDLVLHGGPAPGTLRDAPCRRGMTWHWDGVDFETLHPPDQGSRDDNNGSCVLRVTAGGHALLLPGDIEAEGEAAIAADLRDGPPLDLLIAPHHGSKTSSTPAFVAAVQPRHVVFAAGFRNRFGFPRPEIVVRYAAIGSVAISTFQSGAVSYGLGQDHAIPEYYRREQRRYWHALDD